jgi:hypothetical protein
VLRRQKRRRKEEITERRERERETLYSCDGEVRAEGSQAMPARPSDKGRIRVNTLRWYTVRA